MAKPAKTYDEQLLVLKSRGLTVLDEASAIRWLQHHNYYRLSAYRFPFTLPGNADQFVPGTTFEQVCALYTFDAKLRQLLFEACERVEVSIRARWAYETGHQLGPLGYLNNQNFANPAIHARTLENLESEIQRSNEDFIRHHVDQLKMPWPPVWVISEVASFGTISKLLANTTPPRLRQDVSDTYGLDEKVLCSLIHSLTVLRNIVAHHARIWNRSFTFTVKLPRKKPANLRQNFHVDSTQARGKQRKIYNTLVFLNYLIQLIEPGSLWPSRLAAHLESLEERLIPEMGFPQDWRTRPIWRDLAS